MGLKADLNLLNGDFQKINRSFTDNQVANAALRMGAMPIQEQMKQNASHDPKIISGNLYNSIQVGRLKNKGTRKSIDIGVHTNASAFYAAWVEFGHGGPRPAPAHPYVVPAFDARAEEAYQNIKQVLANALLLK